MAGRPYPVGAEQIREFAGRLTLSDVTVVAGAALPRSVLRRSGVCETLVDDVHFGWSGER